MCVENLILVDSVEKKDISGCPTLPQNNVSDEPVATHFVYCVTLFQQQATKIERYFFIGKFDVHCSIKHIKIL